MCCFCVSGPLLASSLKHHLASSDPFSGYWEASNHHSQYCCWRGKWYDSRPKNHHAAVSRVAVSIESLDFRSAWINFVSRFHCFVDFHSLYRVKYAKRLKDRYDSSCLAKNSKLRHQLSFVKLWIIRTVKASLDCHPQQFYYCFRFRFVWLTPSLNFLWRQVFQLIIAPQLCS